MTFTIRMRGDSVLYLAFDTSRGRRTLYNLVLESIPVLRFRTLCISLQKLLQPAAFVPGGVALQVVFRRSGSGIASRCLREKPSGVSRDSEAGACQFLRPYHSVVGESRPGDGGAHRFWLHLRDRPSENLLNERLAGRREADESGRIQAAFSAKERLSCFLHRW